MQQQCFTTVADALRHWSALQHDWQTRARAGPAAPPAGAAAAAAEGRLQVEAAEEAAWMLHRLGQQHVLDSLLLPDEIEEKTREIEGEVSAAQAALDEMAAHIREGTSGTSWPADGAPSSSGEDGAQQLEALRKAIFADLKFKHEPLEWVYDGLAPLMLPDVLRRRKGIPIALALAAAALARRLGAGARLVCARDAEVLTTEAGEQA
ncbi:hypothetical protein MNEG_10072 [Monoraphidium neglectum]|uniref:Protein SirB1 N-terminal domain-containing protein n=1 Tax=Monoraphidium neglectum TaxID=145388 RepID=A0A0D2JE85_9CHLO|nr:hypothetical protein MNEG_10072 [Monoraphidium neglectum]KIY97887.1 hypothetical protein MNEG_10072 [Monoraphidium neglectum]|eukprot:XP_013896907.1 hypothetical protein MNEG_10072 [Monoraphidium neglectum]